jgi:hypothetical protein
MASSPFFSSNSTYTVAYSTTPGSLSLAPSAVLNILNLDSANVVFVSAGYGNVTANVTTGVGTAIAAKDTVQLQFPVNSVPGNAVLYVSVAGVSSSGNVYVTPGNFDVII